MKINGFNSQGEVDGNLSFKLYWPQVYMMAIGDKALLVMHDGKMCVDFG